MLGGSWWPYEDNSVCQEILKCVPQVVQDVLMDGSCTDPSAKQWNNLLFLDISSSNLLQYA
jgi:hypothetical protein